MKHEDEDRLEDALGEFRRPPQLDREGLWQRIDGALQRRRRVRRAIVWTSAMAAALVLGVLVGRLGPDRIPPRPAPTAVSPYHAVLASTLGEAILVLEDFDPSTATPATSARARHTLANVRLLMELSKERDSSTAALLADLELVLAQAVYAMEAPSPGGGARVAQTVRQRGLAARLKGAAPRTGPGAMPMGI